MAAFLDLSTIRTTVRDGDVVAPRALYSFNSVRRGPRDQPASNGAISPSFRMTPDILYDQMIGMGVAQALRLLLGGQPWRRFASIGFMMPWKAAGLSRCSSKSARTLGGRFVSSWAQPICRSRRLRGTSALIIRNRQRPDSSDRLSIFTGGRRLAAKSPRFAADGRDSHSERTRNGNVLLEGILGVQHEAVTAREARWSSASRRDRGSTSDRAVRTRPFFLACDYRNREGARRRIPPLRWHTILATTASWHR